MFAGEKQRELDDAGAREVVEDALSPNRCQEGGS